MPKTMKTKTKECQVGGEHYERFKIEPIRVFIAFNFNWFQGEILKYVSRFPYKNGEEDLNKAVHIAQMAKELKVGVGNTNKPKKVISFIGRINRKKYLLDLVEDFRKQFEYEEYISIILVGLVEENYEQVKEWIIKLKHKYYG